MGYFQFCGRWDRLYYYQQGLEPEWSNWLPSVWSNEKMSRWPVKPENVNAAAMKKTSVRIVVVK